MSNDLYFTDKQYLELLIRARKLLDRVDKVSCYDSTEIGNKYTESNVGLCNDEKLCTKEVALFPKEWPQRKDLKYLGNEQLCPLDSKVKYNGQGCFYKCLIFQKGFKDIKKIKRLYEKKILKVILA